MSKTILAVSTFILGMCCGLLLNNRTPIVVASSLGPQASTPGPHRMVFHGGGVSNSGTAVAIQGAIPAFIPLDKTPIFEDFTISNSGQSLDGLDCRGCAFDNARLRYGGGAFNFENVKFSGTTRLVFEGAAANTIAFLRFLNGLSVGTPIESPAPNKPIRKRATTPKPLPEINFTPPFIGPKG